MDNGFLLLIYTVVGWTLIVTVYAIIEHGYLYHKKLEYRKKSSKMNKIPKKPKQFVTKKF
jgi:hypothetical protein